MTSTETDLQHLHAYIVKPDTKTSIYTSTKERGLALGIGLWTYTEDTSIIHKEHGARGLFWAKIHIYLVVSS